MNNCTAGFEPVAECLRRDHAPEALIRQFEKQFRLLAAGATGLISGATIEPPCDIPDASVLEQFRPAGGQALARAVVIKLNGGLGTGMGLEHAKSLVPVKDGRTFLDVIIGQIEYFRRTHGAGLPLLLMNSASTQADTLQALAGHPELTAGQRGIEPCFLQHRVPKLRQDNLRPVECPAHPDQAWCPPGHGDIYLALVTSGRLPQLLAQGYEYAFVSNSDNLGATLDVDLLGFFATRRLPFLMEVTRRTPADRKGGHLAQLRGGGLVLRESAQCPPDETDEFQDIERYRYFNTNNLWVNLRALAAAMDAGGLDLPPICNRKTADPRDAASAPVFQLETAMGAAIALFAGAGAVCVPRTRFAPVKTTEDLLALWSDAYEFTADQRMVLCAERRGQPVVVQLDGRHYKLYDRFAAHFPHGAPSLRAAGSLKIEGDVTFGAGVRVTGRTHLCATQPARVPDGSALSGEVML